MDSRMPELSVVIPVYNEFGNIAPLTDEIMAALAGYGNFEIVFVDDCSSDGSDEELRTVAAHHHNVRTVRHDSNRGQSAAVRTGVKLARSELIAVIDGDGQNDPADIPRLVRTLQDTQNVRMVIGERLRRRDNWLKLFSSRVANRVRAFLLKDGIRDTGCGIKAFYRQDFLELPAFDHMHRFLPALLQSEGAAVVSVPVNHRPRVHGDSKYGVRNRLWVGIVDLLGVIWLRHRQI